MICARVFSIHIRTRTHSHTHTHKCTYIYIYIYTQILEESLEVKLPTYGQMKKQGRVREEQEEEERRCRRAKR